MPIITADASFPAVLKMDIPLVSVTDATVRFALVVADYGDEPIEDVGYYKEEDIAVAYHGDFTLDGTIISGYVTSIVYSYFAHIYEYYGDEENWDYYENDGAQLTSSSPLYIYDIGAFQLSGVIGMQLLLSGDDELYGLTSGFMGNDRIHVAKAVAVDGGAGNDSLAFDLSETGLRLDLQETGSLFRSIESFVGSGFDDSVLGSLTGDRISGGAGDDRLTGRDGNDNLGGDAGNDALSGSDGNDTLEGGDGRDTLAGGDGGDRLDGGAGNDVLSGGNDRDVLSGGSGDDRIDGGADRDTLAGGDGNDTLIGGADNDMLAGDAGRDSLDGGTGDDRISGGADNDVLTGQTGNDSLTGGDGNDTLIGGAGHDRIEGGLGRDTLTGGDGHDLFIYDTVDDSPATAPDLVTDFVYHNDLIRLTFIDANSQLDGNQGFRFLGTSAFTGAGGELRTFSSSGQTTVLADLDGDRVADFRLTVSTATVLTAADFLL